jgi:hypothetical protein
MYRVALHVSLVLLALSVAKAALASDPFPVTIQTELKLAEPPLCTLCHQTLIGGVMTVVKPFGKTVHEKYQVSALDVAGLRAALMKMQQNGDDSDGDGVSDIAELLQGQDPNVPQEGGIVVEEGPRYGCQCNTVGRPTSSMAAGAAWLSGLLLSSRRRRASHRGRERDT